jgi:hypothetical protein
MSSTDRALTSNEPYRGPTILTQAELSMRDGGRIPAMGHWRAGFLMFLYCLGLLLLFDLMYSNFIYKEDPAARDPTPARIANTQYHHGFAASFSGYDVWGGSKYGLSTNSLGFKDGSTRIVPLVEEMRRVLLIGDSFTEGIGVPFNRTFAGLLYRDGLESAKKTEFLNAAVAGYSPIIYYKKIKVLLESGLQFDEVVVFPDLSDPLDEAGRYFCIDEDPQYSAYCYPEPVVAKRKPPGFLARNFTLADRIRSIIKQAAHSWRQPVKAIPPEQRKGWTLPGFDRPLPPLGLEGGIARALRNMQKLADLLAAHRIPLTLVVYPEASVLFYDDRESRQIAIWRAFCVENCRKFIDLFPPFFAEKYAHKDWYERLFIQGDTHFSAGGHFLMFRELARHLL